jgi:two-component sensor histidine kinase
MMKGVAQAQVDDSHDVIREVHHQVKNTLQVVCSLLRLEGRAVGESTARESLRRSEGRVQSMALVYDTLYREGLCLEVPIDRYIRALTEHVVKAWGQVGKTIQVQYALDSARMPTKAAISCGLILNEVLLDCLGCAESHCGASFLWVRSDTYKNGVRLRVDLEHEGLVPHELPKLSGQIVRALVQQYGGSLELHGVNGLRYSIDLPELSSR